MSDQKVQELFKKWEKEDFDSVKMKDALLKGAGVPLTQSMNENTASEGGNFVPVEYARRFYELVQAQATALAICDNIPMRNEVLKIPTVSSASTAYWIDDSTTITASKVGVGQLSLTAKKVGALIGVSSEVWDDSDPAIANMLMQQMAKDVALKLDVEIYEGTSTQFTPFDGFASRTTSTATELNIVIGTDASGDALTVDKISDAIGKIQAANFNPTHMVIHPRMLHKLRTLKDTTNNFPLMNEASYGSPVLQDGAIGTVLGLKVVPSTQLSIARTKGTQGTALSDILILTQGKTGIVGSRRDLKINTQYDIQLDQYMIQMNMRAGFAIPYPKSGAVIIDLLTA